MQTSPLVPSVPAVPETSLSVRFFFHKTTFSDGTHHLELTPTGEVFTVDKFTRRERAAHLTLRHCEQYTADGDWIEKNGPSQSDSQTLWK